jgi:type IV pilus assembly protein PilY1
MVDAETGTLKWSMASSDATTSFAGDHSIASSIATLDSDADGLIDRLYTGDTGGNIWRVDMPSDNPTGDHPWSVFKLASLGGNTNLTDRRFFNEPSVVRTFITETIESQVTDAEGETSTVTVRQEVPYEAILLGSGDRSNPLGTDTDDVFFMIKDKNITTQTFDSNSTPSTPSAITISELYDFTDDPFGNVSSEGLEALSVAVSEKSGWFFDLEQDGEKSTSSAIVINNTVYFTTFTPPNLAQDQEGCDLPNGQGWLYGVDLALGIKKFNWATEDSKNREDRISFISEQFLGAPTLIVIPDDPDDEESDTTGNLIVGRKIVPVGFNLQTMRTYLYVTEDQ